jgi:hypothetical protein
MKRIVKCALVLLAAATAAGRGLPAQAGDAPRMADVMSPAEMQATGISYMTPVQRAALDAWLARYTGIVERASSHGAQNAAGNASSSGSTSGSGAEMLPPFPYGSRVAAIEDGGTTILLADGTVWEVNLPDRTNTARWAKGDYVIIGPRAIELNNEFFFQIVDGRDGTSAAVKWRGKGSN